MLRILTLFAWALAVTGHAQTAVSGRVFDGATGMPLPFVNVSFAGTSIGTMTDGEGMYALEAGGQRVTRAHYSCLGYQSQTISCNATCRRSSTWRSRRAAWTSRPQWSGRTRRPSTPPSP